MNEFGRSKLAELAFVGKQNQHLGLLQKVADEVYRKVTCLIKEYSIDAVAFIPPSLSRKVQILDVLRERIEYMHMSYIHLEKDYPGEVVIPQKSLRKRHERVLNARNTIYLVENDIDAYERVLLIDDFVGS